MNRIFLFESLLAQLKARGLTYKQVAQGLGVSEPTIKRIFSSIDGSIELLDQLCHFLNIKLADLMKCAPKKRRLIEHLTIKGDGSGQSLASDLLAHAQGAVAPSWQRRKSKHATQLNTPNNASRPPCACRPFLHTSTLRQKSIA